MDSFFPTDHPRMLEKMKLSLVEVVSPATLRDARFDVTMDAARGMVIRLDREILGEKILGEKVNVPFTVTARVPAETRTVKGVGRTPLLSLLGASLGALAVSVALGQPALLSGVLMAVAIIAGYGRKAKDQVFEFESRCIPTSGTVTVHPERTILFPDLIVPFDQDRYIIHESLRASDPVLDEF